MEIDRPGCGIPLYEKRRCDARDLEVIPSSLFKARLSPRLPGREGSAWGHIMQSGGTPFDRKKLLGGCLKEASPKKRKHSIAFAASRLAQKERAAAKLAARLIGQRPSRG